MKPVIFLIGVLSAFGQSFNQQTTLAGVPWIVHVTTSVSASGTYAITVQQNGTNVQNIQSAVVSCGTNTFTVSQAQNGAAATATALSQTISGTVAASSNFFGVISPYTLNTPLTATAWIASNVGTGTPLSGIQSFSGLQPLVPLPGRSYIAVLAAYASGGSQVPNNYTINFTNTGSGSCPLVADIYGIQAQ